jgi:hypothetical protein
LPMAMKYVMSDENKETAITIERTEKGKFTIQLSKNVWDKNNLLLQDVVSIELSRGELINLQQAIGIIAHIVL